VFQHFDQKPLEEPAFALTVIDTIHVNARERVKQNTFQQKTKHKCLYITVYTTQVNLYCKYYAKQATCLGP
jgi:hypothetical protein